MTQLIQSSSASLQTTNAWGFLPTSSSPTSISGYLSVHVTIDLTPPAAAQSVASNSVSIHELVAERHKDPSKAAAMARARKKHATTLLESPECSLARLRLEKGLSQSQLADRMKVAQSYIARVERGENDVKTSTIERIATALGIDQMLVFQAVVAMRPRAENSNG